MTQALTPEEFASVRRLVAQHIGTLVTEDQAEWIATRLDPRLRATHTDSYASYLLQLECEQPGEELAAFIGALTTHFTAFFRERHHFDTLAAVAPQLRASWTSSRPLRVWSAGSSSGEEAYTIAIVLADLWGANPANFQILATDVDPAMAHSGTMGIYDALALESLDPHVRDRYFLEGTGSNAGRFRVKSELRATVKFAVQNLLEPWSHPAPFDVIFCRNLLIYFSPPVFESTVTRLEQALCPDGLLLLGHSEVLKSAHSTLVPLGRTAYRRRAVPAAEAKAEAA